MCEVRQQAGKKRSRKQTDKRGGGAAAPHRWCQDLTAAYIIPVHDFPLSDFEEAVLVQAQHLHGNKWTQIAEQYMPWRPPLDLRSFRCGRGAAAKAAQNWLCQGGYSLDWLLTHSTPEYQGLWERYHAAVQATGGPAPGRGTKRSFSSKQHQAGSKYSSRGAALQPDIQAAWLHAGSAAAGTASWQDMPHLQGLDAAFQAACAAVQPAAAGAGDPGTWAQGPPMPPTTQQPMDAAQGYSYSQGGLTWGASCSMPMHSTAPPGASAAAGSWVPGGLPLQLPMHAAGAPARRISTSVSTAPWPWLGSTASDGLNLMYAQQQQQQQLLHPAQTSSHGSSSPGLFDSILTAAPHAGVAAAAAAAAAALSAPAMMQPAAAGRPTGAAGAGINNRQRRYEALEPQAVLSTGKFAGAGLGLGVADAAGSMAGSSGLHLHAGGLQRALAQASQAQGPVGITRLHAAVPPQGVQQPCGIALTQDSDPFSFLDSMPAFEVPSWAQEAAEQAAAAALAAHSGPSCAGAGHGSSDRQQQEAARQCASASGSATLLWVDCRNPDSSSAPGWSCLLPSPVAVDAPSWAEEAAEQAAAAAMGLYAASTAGGADVAASAAQHASAAACQAHMQPVGAVDGSSPLQESSLSAGTVFGSAVAPVPPQMHQHDSSSCRSLDSDSIAVAHKLSTRQGVPAAPAAAMHQPLPAPLPGNSGSSGSCSVGNSSRGVSTPDCASTATGAVFRLQGPGPTSSPSAGTAAHRELSSPHASAADAHAAVNCRGPEAAAAHAVAGPDLPPAGAEGSSSVRHEQQVAGQQMQGGAQQQMQGSEQQQQQSGQEPGFYSSLLNQLLQQIPAAAPCTEGLMQAKGSPAHSPAASAAAGAVAGVTAGSQGPNGSRPAVLTRDGGQQLSQQSTAINNSTAASAGGDLKPPAGARVLQLSSMGEFRQAAAGLGCARQQQQPLAAYAADSKPLGPAVCEAQTAQQQLLAAVIQQDGSIAALAAAGATAAKASGQRIAQQQQHGVCAASTLAAGLAPAGQTIQQQDPAASAACGASPRAGCSAALLQAQTIQQQQPAAAAARDASQRPGCSAALLQAQPEGQHVQQYTCAAALPLLVTTDATDLDTFFGMDGGLGLDSFFDSAFEFF